MRDGVRLHALIVTPKILRIPRPFSSALPRRGPTLPAGALARGARSWPVKAQGSGWDNECPGRPLERGHRV